MTTGRGAKTETFGVNYLGRTSSYTNTLTGANKSFPMWPSGEMFARTDNVAATNVIFATLDGETITEYDQAGAGAATLKNTFSGLGLNGKTTRIPASGGRAHYVGDHVNTLAMTLSDTGAPTETVVKGAYGEAIAGSTAESYSGIAQAMRIDGLDYMHNRMYDPDDGEFLANDPIVGNRAGASYGYSSGDPLRFIDPWGLQDLSWEARKPLPWWTRTWRAATGILLKDTPWEPHNMEAQAAIDNYRRFNAAAGMAVLDFAQKRGGPTLQIVTGVAEIAAGIQTVNPILFLHGFDMLGTGAMGWRDGRTYDTTTSQGIMYGAREWLKLDEASVRVLGIAGDMSPSCAPALLGPAIRRSLQEANMLYQFARPGSSSGASQLVSAQRAAWFVEGSSCGAMQRPQYVTGYGYKDAEWRQAVQQLQEGQDLQVRTLRAAAELRRDAFLGFTRSKYRGKLSEAPDLTGTYDWHDPAVVPHPPGHRIPHIQIWDEENNVVRIIVNPKSTRVERFAGAKE